MGFAGKFNAAATRLSVKAAFAFPDTCAVQSPTETTARGQVSQGWATITGLSLVPCLGKPLSGSERVVGGAPSAIEEEEWLMPARLGGAEVAIQANHRFIVAARGVQGARTYEVTSVGSVSAVLLKVIATRVG